jgi:CBS domain-containing protein
MFVWMGAGQEAAMAKAEALLSNVTVERAMIRDFYAVHDHDALAKVVQLGLLTPQNDFPVLDGSALVGMLNKNQLVRGLRDYGGQGLVSAAMGGDDPVLTVEETLEEAFRKFQSCQCSTLPVLRDGRLEGLLTRENLHAFISFQQALERGGRDPRTPAAAQPVKPSEV